MADADILLQLRADVENIKKEIKALDSQVETSNKRQAKSSEDSAKRQKQALKSIVPFYDKIDNSLESVGVKLDNISKSSGGVKGAFLSVQKSIVGATRAALAFAATPVGFALLLGSGLALATKNLIKFNVNIAPTIRQIESITKSTGDLTNELFGQATAIEKVYGVSIKESLDSAKVLVNEFGLSYSDAFKLINKELAQGASSNDEFFQSVREYSTFFSNAGFSAQEFANVIETGFDLGIYSDKLPDAIKEATISLQEQTSASRDALQNAFGSEFTNNLFSNIQNGSITVKDALLEISEEIDNVGINSQQSAQLTADLFRGAGEDAGGALVVFDAINQSLNNQQTELTKLQQAQSDAVDSLAELNEAKLRAFRSDEAVAFNQDLKEVWRSIQTGYFNTIADVRDFFSEVERRNIRNRALFDVTWKNIPVVARNVFNALLKDLKAIGGQFVKLGEVASFSITGKFKKASQAFNEFRDSDKLFSNTVKDAKFNAKEMERVWGVASDAANNYYNELNKGRQQRAAVDRRFADGGGELLPDGSIANLKIKLQKLKTQLERLDPTSDLFKTIKEEAVNTEKKINELTGKVSNSQNKFQNETKQATQALKDSLQGLRNEVSEIDKEINNLSISDPNRTDLIRKKVELEFEIENAIKAQQELEKQVRDSLTTEVIPIEVKALPRVAPKQNDPQIASELKEQIKDSLNIGDIELSNEVDFSELTPDRDSLGRIEQGTELFKQQQEQIKQYQNASSAFSALGSAFGDLSQQFEEGSAAQVAALKLQQIAAIGTAIANIQLALSQAASLPFPANLPAIASVISAVSQIAGAVKAFAGQSESNVPSFYEGTEYVTGTPQQNIKKDGIPAFLNRGERVIPTELNKQLKGISNFELVKRMSYNFIPDNYHAELIYQPMRNALNSYRESERQKEEGYKEIVKELRLIERRREQKENRQRQLNNSKSKPRKRYNK